MGHGRGGSAPAPRTINQHVTVPRLGLDRNSVGVQPDPARPSVFTFLAAHSAVDGTWQEFGSSDIGVPRITYSYGWFQQLAAVAGDRVTGVVIDSVEQDLTAPAGFVVSRDVDPLTTSLDTFGFPYSTVSIQHVENWDRVARASGDVGGTPRAVLDTTTWPPNMVVRFHRTTAQPAFTLAQGPAADGRQVILSYTISGVTGAGGPSSDNMAATKMIEWGDGTYDYPTAALAGSVAHTYAEPGTYQVSLAVFPYQTGPQNQVVDHPDGTSTAELVSFGAGTAGTWTVDPPPDLTEAHLSATPTSVVQGQPIVFSGVRVTTQ